MIDVARRRFLLAGLLGWPCAQRVLAQAPAPAGGGSRVYMFAVLDLRPHVLQKMLEEHMPAVNVTVFGRVGDFTRALVDSPPDAALALAPALASIELRADLQGTLAGSPLEEYVVVSETRLEPRELATLNIGCIDLVGRKKLPAFVKSVLGLPVEPEVTGVTKIEDLLQLLQFRRVGAVLIALRFFPELSSRSRMALEVLHVPSAMVPRMAIAFTGNRRAVEGPLRALPLELIRRLGVDAWR